MKSKLSLLFICFILVASCSTPVEPIEEVESYKILFIATSVSTGEPCVGIFFQVTCHPGFDDGKAQYRKYTNNQGRALFVITDKRLDGQRWQGLIKVERGEYYDCHSGIVHFGEMVTYEMTPCGWL